MGLIKAFIGATAGTLADQWKEYIACDSLSNDTLVARGHKQVNGKRSSNTKGNDNIISNGSVIAVADGQCMIIVEKGKVVELCAEPGAFKYDTSSESSFFTGSLGERLGGFFKTLGSRFTYGGDTGNDQRVYYFNIKEILDNKFGTPQPVPFRVVDKNVGLDIDVSVRCAGVFSYKISNPILFYQNVCGNIEEDYKKSNIATQLKSEFISALQPAFGQLSALEMRPNQIVAHTAELEKAMNEALKAKWADLRGLEVVTIALATVTLPEDDQELIKDIQRKSVYRNAGMAGATLVDAQAEAMKAAAGNANGAMNGFIGMGMAMNAGGMSNASQFYGMAQQQGAKQANANQAADTWTCPNCGAKVSGKFCTECGAKKPEQQAGWTCPNCGKVNKGKFCGECGTKKPAGEPLYKCDKCGWEPEDPKNPPKFCPQCGDPFNDNDIK